MPNRTFLRPSPRSMPAALFLCAVVSFFAGCRAFAAAGEEPEAEGDDLSALIEKTIDAACGKLVEEQATDAAAGDYALVIGVFYHTGLFGEPDAAKAERYMLLAREKNTPEAGVSLADLYIGLTRGEAPPGGFDEARGMRYLAEAAEADNVDALRLLGLLHEAGADGMEADEAKAAAYFRKAARHGDALALGRVVPMDAEEGETQQDVQERVKKLVVPELMAAATARAEKLAETIEAVNARIEREIMAVVKDNALQ